MSIDTSSLMALLEPTSFWDWWLYIIFVNYLILLFMQGDGALTETLLLAAGVIAIFADKVSIFGTYGGRNCGLEYMVLRIAIFVIPLLIAGISKNEKSRLPAIIAVVLAGGYMFMSWFMILASDQCPRESSDKIVLLPFAFRFIKDHTHRVVWTKTQA